MKSKDRVSILIRLNLAKPDHRKVWEKLQQSNRSYTDEIVAQFNHEKRIDYETLQAIVETTVRETISRCLNGSSLVAFPSASATVPSDEGEAEISDEDFQLADDFINSL